MADIAFGIVGGAVGAFYGNWQAGFSIGMTLGGLLFPPKAGEVENGKSDVRIQDSSYGSAISLGYGTFRTAGTIVWGTEAREVVNTTGGGKGKPKTKNYSYYASFAVIVCAGPIHKIRRIWANSRVIYENTSGTGYVAASPVTSHGTGAKWDKHLNPDDVRIYLGSDDQPRDPAIEAEMGTNDTPAYRRRAAVVFEDFPMTPFGNSIPNLEFEVETVSGGTVTLEAMLDDLSDRCGIGSGLRDFSALASKTVSGCVINSRSEARSVFESAQRAYVCEIVEYDGKLRALDPSDDPTPLEVPASWLGTGLGAPSENGYDIRRLQEQEIPRQVNVVYQSKALDLQSFAQNAVRVGGSVEEPETISLPFVMGEVEAKQTAMVNLHLRAMHRNTFTLALPLRAMPLVPGSRLSVDLPSIGETLLKVVECSVDFFGPLSVVAVRDDPRVYQQTAEGTTVDYPNEGVGDAGTPLFALVDSGPLYDSHSDYPTLMYAGSGGGQPWPGATVRVAETIKSAVGSWETDVADLELKSAIGTVVDPIPTWDPSNVVQDITVTVDLESGELESCTDSELLNGANVAAWGDELFQFKTATNVGGGIWQLTGILRGRRGTTWAGDGHVDGERFVLLTSATARAFSAADTEHGVEREHEMLEDGVNYSSTVPESITHETRSNSAKALPPVLLNVARDGSQNATITWTRQDRKGFDWPDGSDVPMSEPSLGFDVEVWTSGYSSLVRTLTTGIESAAYPASLQVTDFGATQSTLWLKVYQKQTTRPWQRGHAAEHQG